MITAVDTVVALLVIGGAITSLGALLLLGLCRCAAEEDLAREQWLRELSEKEGRL